jgi:hypothetical protein
MAKKNEDDRIELKDAYIKHVPGKSYTPWSQSGWYLVCSFSSPGKYDRVVVQLLEKSKN